jgi:predicted amidohydrolase YtcJ
VVDLILYNARAITMDSARPRAELMAIRDQDIVAVTTNEKRSELASHRTKVIDCRGHTVLPGFIDAHCHIHAVAESLVTVDIGPRSSIRSIRDIQAALRQAASRTPPATWLRASGYDEFFLEDKRHPTREDLDPAVPLHPVKLTHRSGHAHVLNTVGLRNAGITIDTPDPEGGLIDRHHETGEPTGVLFGMGKSLATRIPRLEDVHVETGMRRANRHFLSLGITSIQDPSPRNGRLQWQRFRRWKAEDILRPRVTMMLGWDAFLRRSEEDFSRTTSIEHLRIPGVKIVIDETSGQLHPNPSELDAMVVAIHRAGLQAVLHAVDPPAIEAACRSIADALRRVPRADHRHRIEHCSVCPPALRHRLASLGVFVVTQPSFLHYNAERYVRTLAPAQLAELYPIGGLLSAGVSVAAGSDSPIVPVDPFKAISGAMSRHAGTGAPISPEHAVSLHAALGMYTASAARAAFEDGWKGSITPGKKADLIVLDRDITRVPQDEVADVKIQMTILDGRIAWET